MQKIFLLVGRIHTLEWVEPVAAPVAAAEDKHLNLQGVQSCRY